MSSVQARLGAVTRRPSQCDSLATLGSTGCSDHRGGDSSSSLAHGTDDDGIGDQSLADTGLHDAAHNTDPFDSVVELSHVGTQSGPSPPQDGDHLGKPSLTNCSTSGHSDQTDDITTGSSTTNDTTTPAIRLQTAPCAIGHDDRAPAEVATVVVALRSPTVATSPTVAPLPIDFPASNTAAAPPPRLSSCLSPTFPQYTEYRSDYAASNTPTLMYQPLSSAGRPWSFSSHSTPTSHGGNGFPPSTSPLMWRTEAQTMRRGRSMSSSSFRQDEQCIPSAPYYSPFTSVPASREGRYTYSPVSTLSRQASLYDNERGADGSDFDGAASGAHTGPNNGYGWGNGSGYERPYRSAYTTVPSPLSHHGLTPQSLHEEGSVSDGSGWASDVSPAYYAHVGGSAGSTGGCAAGRQPFTTAASMSPDVSSTSPSYRSPSPAVGAAQSVGPHPSAFSLGLSADCTVVPEHTSLVSRHDLLSHVCQRILRDAASTSGSADSEDDWWLQTIALDLEGRDLGRHGSVCIITLATVECVYLVDMIELGAAALSPGSPLRRVLESPHVTKLMYDCRADCDALFFLYNVRLSGVCDLQPAVCHGLFPNSSHLPGMKDAFQRLGLLSDEERTIKEAGRMLFDPKSGGSFEHWEVRPLVPLLTKYCAVDVKYFFMARALLWSYLSVGYEVGQARIAHVCEGRFEGFSKSNALRDFV